MIDISFFYHVLVSMALFFSIAFILKDIRGVFLATLSVGVFKELIDPVFTISDFVGDFLGCSLAYLFCLFLLDALQGSSRRR